MIRALPFVVMATPVVAQDTFSLPAGCEAYLTIQYRSCEVSHHFTCTGDSEGLQRRVQLDERGLTYAGAIDAETQWIESFHILSGHTERLEQSPADPASMTELMAAQVDTYDFRTLSDEIGVTRYKGSDRLTGVVVEIDGVTLHQTEFQITATGMDGAVQWSAQGREFISEDFRMFISGTSEITTPSDTWETDDTPVEFLFPGETGFLSANPKHGCGVMMSSYEGSK